MDITFNNDPKLSILIPVFYLAWQDDFLSKNEFTTLNDFINKQDWFTKAEKEFLKSKIDYTSPPSRSELFHWKEKIDKALDNSKKPSNLTELGILIANAERQALNEEDIRIIGTSFAKMESELGVMSREVISGFKKSKDTITHSYKTIESFDVKLLIDFLDGSQAATINKVKQLISSPEFALDIPENIMEYREKVLEWSKSLSKHNLGAYAYPKEHGGKDDIEGYFSVMETLSYHDLSLVIKFGVQFGLWGMSILSLGTEKHYKKYLKDIGT